MELLLAFAVGWAVGARAGESGFREVVDAARELRRSEEFRALIDVMRSHMASGLRAFADVLADREVPITPDSVVERVLRVMGRDPTSSAS